MTFLCVLMPVQQSPILSVYRVALPFRFTICGDPFPNIDRMPNLECPVLVIHGTRDELVPFEHGQVHDYRSCLPVAFITQYLLLPFVAKLS
jgi:fermentation-respiration switch protein FrsA (DUF1100 family)